MVTKNEICQALVDVVSDGRVGESWWMDESICAIINHCKGWELSKGSLNRAVSGSSLLVDIDNDGGALGGTIFRHRQRVQSGNRHFFFLSKIGNKPCKRHTQQQWEAFASKKVPRLSLRSAFSSVTPTPAPRKRPRDMEFAEHNNMVPADTQNAIPTPQRLTTLPPNLSRDHTPPPLATRAPTSRAPTPPPFPTGYWHDSKARKLFNIQQGDVRKGLQEVMELIDESIQNQDLSPIMTASAESMAEAAIPEYRALETMSRIKYLRVAYSIALVKLGHGLSWEQCCERAIDSMVLTGESRCHPTTVMKWHRLFRRTWKFPHPYESSNHY